MDHRPREHDDDDEKVRSGRVVGWLSGALTWRWKGLRWRSDSAMMAWLAGMARPPYTHMRCRMSTYLIYTKRKTDRPEKATTATR
jgi:hypothetical protein